LVKIAVFEFLCGGGHNELLGVSDGDFDLENRFLHPSLAAEGWGMLNAICLDLRGCGHQVHTCLDETVAHRLKLGRSPLPARIDYLHPKTDWLETWLEIASRCDRTLVIAPELKGHLLRVVSAMRAAGISVQAPSDRFLQLASDKLLFAQVMHDSGRLHPQTSTLHESFATGESAFTLKRRDGAGCADMKWFPNASALATWVSAIACSIEPYDDWIVQPWRPGQAMSLAVIAGVAHNGSSTVLQAMEQTIEIVPTDDTLTAWQVEYRGSQLPVVHVSPIEVEAFAAAVLSAMRHGTVSADQTLDCVAGWIGIDFVVPPDAENWRDWVVIEVNPRLTSSYLSYRKIYGKKLADATLGLGACSAG
jgi:tyramine---L-glutamate ligase